ncbi:aminoglycoside phosphotransferase family protein [Nocardioides stalactiti]|uniref:aminoglycoside phosphotransferase family protein n=1 Tax=Nocardioides stalactiti TaxID=2755356 RepID=UPI0016007F71|nr:aminoglycoside phosphotransferase family protein [Nocardioides stalactiti]
MTDLDAFLRDPDLVVQVARSPLDQTRIRQEFEGRRWASAHGVTTAETVAKDPADRWLVSRRVVEATGESSRYVDAAFEAALQIQDLPCPDFATTENAWRARRTSFPVRAAKMVAAGVDPRTFLATRAAFEQLPRDATVHNDFHRSNVLDTSAHGAVTVIDWELTSRGPRHQDLVMVVVDLEDAELAHAAWRTLVDLATPEERPALAVQLRWLALRTYASQVTARRIDRGRALKHRRRLRWAAAQDWAGELATESRGVARP